jgi:phage replication-related protein YjqB (UPF0714/DUF867 family)
VPDFRKPNLAFYFSPILLDLLPRTKFVLTLHRANDTREQVAYVGGSWEEGRATLTAMINAATAKHGIHAKEAPARLRGTEPTNLTNRGKLGHGIQLEFSHAARNLLFPPDCSRQARGRRSTRLRLWHEQSTTASSASSQNRALWR